MKKILAFLGITTILSATSTSACAHKHNHLNNKQLDLSNLAIYNLNVFKKSTNELQINVVSSFNLIVQRIISLYNHYLVTSKITANDFIYGNKTNKNHSWAIEIININQQAFSYDLKNPLQTLNFLKNYSILTNNALKVNIRTTNTHVKQRLTTINAFLNKFLYTKKNLNRNHVVDETKASGPNSMNTKGNFIDISQNSPLKIHWTLQYQQTKKHLAEDVLVIPSEAVARISRPILAALNKQLSLETKTLNNLGILKTSQESQIMFKQAYLTVFNILNHKITKITDDNQQIATSVGAKIYVKVFNLSFLNYQPIANAAVYLYLGTTTNSA